MIVEILADFFDIIGRNKRYSADAGILSDKSEGFAPPLSIVHFPFSIQSNHCP